MEGNGMYQNQEEYYVRMVNAVKDLMGGQWEQLVIRICKDDLHSSVGVYFKRDGVFQDMGNYLDKEGLNDEEYDESTDILFDIVNEMRKELREQNKELWTSLVFTVMKDGEYETKYSYDALGENEFVEELNWSYKRLGIIPLEKHRKYLY